MNSRTLGRTGQKVSEIGYGAWGIGKSWWGTTDDAESLRALRRAIDLGVTFFDTAYVYGDGHSEQLIHNAFQEAGVRHFIATKCPPKNRNWPADPRTPLEEAFPEDWITSCTERSLKNLGVDCLDLQQFHVWTDTWMNRDEWKSAVAQLKKQGKIHWFGVSINDMDPESALQLVGSGLVDTVQVIYNIFEQAPAKRLFPLCQKMNVGVIVRVPLDEGGLSGTLTPRTKFEEDDFRKRYFAKGHLEETCVRVEKLKTLLGPYALTIPELALKFILAHPAVSVVIPGMRRMKNVEANTRVSGSAPIPDDVLRELTAHAWKRDRMSLVD
jgi:aryl-alcohol dehydrogenase-like predicted oxidoreductase